MQDKYYHTKESVAQYVETANGYSGRKLIDKMRNFMGAKATVLELGMGPGTDLDILTKYFKTTGSDFSKEFLHQYRAKHPNADLLELDAVSLDTSRKFDGIYSNKVLHHLTDEELHKSVQSQYRILNDEGVICHSFWRGEHPEERDGLYFNFHTLDDLRHFFAETFHVLRLEIYTDLRKGDSLLLIAQKP